MQWGIPVLSPDQEKVARGIEELKIKDYTNEKDFCENNCVPIINDKGQKVCKRTMYSEGVDQKWKRDAKKLDEKATRKEERIIKEKKRKREEEKYRENDSFLVGSELQDLFEERLSDLPPTPKKVSGLFSGGRGGHTVPGTGRGWGKGMS